MLELGAIQGTLRLDETGISDETVKEAGIVRCASLEIEGEARSLGGPWSKDE